MIRSAIFSLLLLLTPLVAVAEEAFYKNANGVFSTRPGTTASLVEVKRFGPVGISLDLIQPAFTMRIGSVEPGSPAEEAGLKKGMMIEAINGDALADIDPRIQLGQIITKAEATDGKVSFQIKGQTKPVVVNIPILGAYSETWPLNCPKSDKIVRGFADYLTNGGHKGFANIGLLFLVSTGDPKDLETARKWIHEGVIRSDSVYAWHIGYGGFGVAEYYLKTGDPKALEIIQEMADNAVAGQYLDAWAGRGGVPRVTYGGGHLNAAGTGAAAFLLLAKECGANVPDEAMLSALRHFYRYAGRGNNPYGDGRPYHSSLVDNGKVGYLAFTMAAAESLTTNGEESLYRHAKEWCANSSFYTAILKPSGVADEYTLGDLLPVLDLVIDGEFLEFFHHRLVPRARRLTCALGDPWAGNPIKVELDAVADGRKIDLVHVVINSFDETEPDRRVLIELPGQRQGFVLVPGAQAVPPHVERVTTPTVGVPDPVGPLAQSPAEMFILNNLALRHHKTPSYPSTTAALPPRLGAGERLFGLLLVVDVVDAKNRGAPVGLRPGLQAFEFSAGDADTRV